MKERSSCCTFTGSTTLKIQTTRSYQKPTLYRHLEGWLPWLFPSAFTDLPLSKVRM